MVSYYLSIPKPSTIPTSCMFDSYWKDQRIEFYLLKQAATILIDIIYCALLCFIAQLCPTLGNPTDCSPPGSSVHGNSPSKNTGVGCHALLQGIFPIQGSNSGLPHCRQILYCLSLQGSLTLSTAFFLKGLMVLLHCLYKWASDLV